MWKCAFSVNLGAGHKNPVRRSNPLGANQGRGPPRVPIILSTGMSGVDEVEAAVEQIQSHGNPDIAILHCTSNYPAEPEDCNLAAMATFEPTSIAWWDIPTIAPESTSPSRPSSRRGHLEKHFTLDRGMNGPDHRTSLSPAELKAMILGVRRLEKAIGDGDKRPRPSEAPVAAVARRSLFARTDISRNDSFRIAMLSLSGRPAASLRTASTT